MHVVRLLEHHLLDDLLDRTCDVHLALGDLRLGLPRRSTKELGEAVVGHAVAIQEREVVHVESEGAVVGDVDQLVADHLSVFRLTVGRQTHHLVLPEVHAEAGEVGERRVEESERVRELDLAQQLELTPSAHSVARGRPLPDTVEGQDGGLVEGRGIEGRGCVRLVVLREEDLAVIPDLLGDLGRDEELLFEPHRHGLDEVLEAARGDAQVGHQDALELEHRLVVEGDVVEVRHPDPGLLQAEFDRAPRKIGIRLAAREALLLRGGDNLTIPQEAGGGVVVVGGDPQDMHSRIVAVDARAARGEPR